MSQCSLKWVQICHCIQPIAPFRLLQFLASGLGLMISAKWQYISIHIFMFHAIFNACYLDYCVKSLRCVLLDVIRTKR